MLVFINPGVVLSRNETLHLEKVTDDCNQDDIRNTSVYLKCIFLHSHRKRRDTTFASLKSPKTLIQTALVNLNS